MKARVCSVFLLMLVLTAMAFSYAQPSASPLKSSDAAVFEQASQAAKKSHYAEARTLFENLINDYPNSDYVAPAKLSIADTWYAEGALQRALIEYQDFITFFPNRPEVMETRQKIDTIHKKAKR